MKVNELMIGDWVYYQDKKQMPCRIIAILGYSIKFDNGTQQNWMADVKNFTPIPLTAEILEKNGFVEGRYGEMVLNEELGTSEIYLVLEESHDGEYYWWKVNNEIIAKIKSVHELQHVLNVCGFEKNIIL